MRDFGERLKQLRFERRMTQQEFADLLGTTKQVISRYENGQRVPKVSVAEHYAKKLGISVQRLIPGAAMPDDEDEMWQERQALMDDPDRLALMKLARHGSAQDVRTVAKLIDALRATNPDFYDGDDPA